MKRLSILAFALLCAGAVSAQHLRRVLVEEFTNASCPPCAAQNPGFNATIDANISKLTPIKYQTNWPGVDPMNAQTQTDVAPRVTYYGVTGVPNGRQGGVVEVFPLSNMTAGTINAEVNTPTPVTMVATHHLSPNFDSVYITLAVTSDVALTGTLRLRVAVTEDKITFATAPGSNGETEFFNIMRKMLPNSTGTTTGDFAAGETKTYNFAWKLAYFYDLNQMSISAFLQDDATKAVYQSVRSEPILPAIPGLGASVASKTVFACAAGFIPSFTLENTGNATLTNSLIRYRVGTGAWTDLNWTGNLAAGASEAVPLTSLVVNTAGTINIEIAVINSNLGIQTNLVGGSSFLKVIAAIDPALALPFVNAFQSAVFPPTGWSVDASLATYNWKLATNAGSGSSRSARCSLFITPQGQRPILNSPKIDMSTATGASTLKFDHAYAPYDGTFFDGMSVEVSTDCGVNWTSLYYKAGADLATAPAITTAFVPVAGDWVNDEIDITALNGQAEVIFRFIAESGYGNNLYIDNVNVSTLVGTKELTLTDFNLAPNPTRDVAEVRFGLQTAQKIELRVYSAEGALVQSQLLGELSSGDHTVTMNANTLPSGSYRVVLQGSEGVAQTQWVVVK